MERSVGNPHEEGLYEKRYGVEVFIQAQFWATVFPVQQTK